MRVRSTKAPRSELALLAGACLLAAALSGCISATDFDKDGVLDVDDPDDDNDQVPDLFETEFGFDPFNATDASTDTDHDDLTLLQEHLSGLNPNNPDSDEDGVKDGWEVTNGFDALDASDAAADTDSDGLSNAAEFSNGTEPRNPDSDGDGMRDGWELTHGFNPRSGADAASDADSDDLQNVQEYLSATDPRDPDTDNDTMLDGWEVSFTLNPLDPSDAAADTDQDSFDADLDGAVSDDERFSNLREFQAGTDPRDPDSDHDLVPDGFEWVFLLDPTNPSDNGSDPDGDGATNLQEAEAGSVPNRTDSDGDTMRDGWEIMYNLDPVSPADAALDPDLDGLDNAGEFTRGGDPLDADTDDDGVTDGDDADPARDLVVTLRVTAVSLTLASAGGEGAFDPPFELHLRVSIGGVFLQNATFTMNGTVLQGARTDLDFVFELDVDDGVWGVAVTMELWELDLPETVGVNEDDLVDVDPVGANFTASFSYNLSTGAITGELTGAVADGAADERMGEPDGRIDFEITV